jgi:hypothetical protein
MGFEIDELAFRRANQGRPLAHLVRELIQNTFDEDARFCHVKVQEIPDGLKIEVEDGVKRGIRRLEEVFTIFASGKRDDPTKRGRLGRGLKECVSVCDHAFVATVGKTVEFAWRPGKNLFDRTIHDNGVTSGTTVVCTLGHGRSKRREIETTLRLFIPPPGILYTVNDKEIRRPKLHKTLRAGLRTVVYDQAGTQKESERKTDVILWEPRDGRGWIYEMGIPVEPLQQEDAFRWSIDVQQRVPLKAERDRISRSYMRSLWAQILNQMVDELPKEQTATVWVDEATAHPAFDREGAGRTLVEKRFGERTVRATPNLDDNIQAERGGYTVIHTQSLSEGLREVLRQHTPSATEVVHPKNFESVDAWLGANPEVLVPEEGQTAGERDFVRFAQRMADLMGLPVKRVVITSQEVPAHVAHFTKRSNVVCVCRQGTFYMKGQGDFFRRPRMHDWVDLMIHEFAHREGEGHDVAWQNEMSRLGGRMLYVAPGLLEEFPRGE